jgi:hypothetical protein
MAKIDNILNERWRRDLRDGLAADIRNKYSDRVQPPTLIEAIETFLCMAVPDLLPLRSRLSECRAEVTEKLRAYEDGGQVDAKRESEPQSELSDRRVR